MVEHVKAAKSIEHKCLLWSEAGFCHPRMPHISPKPLVARKHSDYPAYKHHWQSPKLCLSINVPRKLIIRTLCPDPHNLTAKTSIRIPLLIRSAECCRWGWRKGQALLEGLGHVCTSLQLVIAFVCAAFRSRQQHGFIMRRTIVSGV